MTDKEIEEIQRQEFFQYYESVENLFMTKKGKFECLFAFDGKLSSGWFQLRAAEGHGRCSIPRKISERLARLKNMTAANEFKRKFK